MADSPDSPLIFDSFIEAIARLTSYALTDSEKETVVKSFRNFHAQLERIQSDTSLRRHAIESKKRQQPSKNCLHKGTSCEQNAIRGFIKAFLVGYIVKYGIDLVPHILSLKLFKSPSLLLRPFNKDTLSVASFLSVLIGSYKSFLCLLRKYRGKDSSDYTNAFLAGVLSGAISIKLDRSRSRRTSITLYLLSRAMQYGCMWLFNYWAAQHSKSSDKARTSSIKRSYSAGNVAESSSEGRYSRIKGLQMSNVESAQRGVRWTDSTIDNSKEAKKQRSRSEIITKIISIIRATAPTALMSVSCSVIVLTLIFDTDVISRGYLNFLARASGYERFYPKSVGNAIEGIGRNIVHANTPGNFLHGRIPPGVTSKEYISSLPYKLPPTNSLSDEAAHNFASCALIHPQTTSCTRGLISTVLHTLPTALRVYVPLNLAVLLLFKSKNIINHPTSALLKLCKSSIRSSVFFSALVAGLINVSCSMRTILGRETYIGIIITSFIGGLSVLFETPSRRVELAMYCFLRALESAWDVGIKHRWWRNIRHAEVGVFSLAMGVLMSVYQNDPSTMNVTYHSILTRIFGVN